MLKNTSDYITIENIIDLKLKREKSYFFLYFFFWEGEIVYTLCFSLWNVPTFPHVDVVESRRGKINSQPTQLCCFQDA